MSARPRAAEERRRPAGSLAWREYEVKLMSGRTAVLGFSLADPSHKVMACLKREHDASNLGLLVVLDDPNSLEEVVLWFQQSGALTLMSQNGDMEIGEEVKALLPRYFAVFFDEMKNLAPDLSDVRLARVPKADDKNVH